MLKDKRYGFSSLFTGDVGRIDVKGTHMEFFMHEENVVKVAEHLRKLTERDADETAASEKLLWL